LADVIAALEKLWRCSLFLATAKHDALARLRSGGEAEEIEQLLRGRDIGLDILNALRASRQRLCH